MTQWGFYFDQKRCLGCKTCTVACKEWNEGRRGDVANTLTSEELKRFGTPSDWHAGTQRGVSDLTFLRRFDMKENWRQVTFLEKGTRAPKVEIFPLSLACNHCSDPACVKACPVKAIRKETQYGAVLVDSNRCISCGACQMACPWHVPQFFEDRLKSKNKPHMTKCDMCIDRLKLGLKPVCVASCPGRALDCAPMGEIKKKHPQATPDCIGFSRADAQATGANILFNSRKSRL